VSYPKGDFGDTAPWSSAVITGVLISFDRGLVIVKLFIVFLSRGGGPSRFIGDNKIKVDNLNYWESLCYNNEKKNKK